MSFITREDHINNAVDRLAHRGSAVGEQAAGAALARILRAALAEELVNAAKTGKPPLDPRKVCLGIMTNMRQAMAELRDEIDGIDSVGKYA